MALHVDRKQRFLHDVLRVDPAPHDLSPGEATHEAGCPPEEFGIGPFVSRDRGAHQPGKFVFVPAVQACLPPNYVCGRPLLQGWQDFVQALKLPITNSCRRQDVTPGPSRANWRSARPRNGAQQPNGRRQHVYKINRERGHSGRRRRDRACVHGGRRTADGGAGQGGHGRRARRSATASRSRARTTAPPGRAPPARAPRPSTTRAMPGSSSMAAPAPRWNCPAAATARPSR